MQEAGYRNLIVGGTLSVIATPFVGGAVMGYLEHGNTSQNIFSGVILGSLLALLLGIPYVIIESYIGTMIGASFSVSNSLRLWSIVAIAFIVMCTAGSLVGGSVARLTREQPSKP